MNENEIEENARDYTKDAIASVSDAFKWIFKAGDYPCAKLTFDALESLKIVFSNLSECENVWNNRFTKEETVHELKKAFE